MTPIKFDPSISEEMFANITAKLRGIEADNNVRVLFAIESGSRAWGFPSPDSDYDARFVYARPVEDYLTLSPIRDVIELPIEGDYDINGWDIKKALNLLLKPNPVLLEWLSGPVRYIWNDEVCEKLKVFSEQIIHGPACVHHYLNLGETLWHRRIENADAVNLKHYFYALRPAMALRWLGKHPNIVPPMNFQELMAGVDLDAELTEELRKLLKAKAETKELGKGRPVTILDDFILSEFEKAKALTKTIRSEKKQLRPQADRLFREIIDSVSRGEA